MPSIYGLIYRKKSLRTMPNKSFKKDAKSGSPQSPALCYKNKMKIQIFYLISLPILATSLYVLANHTKHGCELIEGKWASNGSYCVTKSCYVNGNCGVWVAPQHWCAKVMEGASISEIYFYLGNPLEINGNIFKWRSSKGSPGFIEAILINDKVVKINCNAK
jgi:hypothetical protein